MIPQIHRTSHVKAYIKGRYPQMDAKKFDIAKIGARIYMYGVDVNGNLQRLFIYQGNLPAMNELEVLKKAFERNVDEAIKKLGYKC